LGQFPYCFETDVTASRNYETDEWYNCVAILEWNVEILRFRLKMHVIVEEYCGVQPAECKWKMLFVIQ
jgi:hypothetical protein